VCFWFPVLVRCLFDSGWKINFEQVQIRSMTMTLASSRLQIQRHEYFGDINIVILVISVGIGRLSFYAINMDDVSLFTDSSFLFLANLDLYRIDVRYQFEWMNVVYFCQKKKLVFKIFFITINIFLMFSWKYQFNHWRSQTNKYYHSWEYKFDSWIIQFFIKFY